ncbi:MAG: ATP-binding domain-containing protein [bacterium]|nr:ATP-binding domain-containing protein [bacterium]
MEENKVNEEQLEQAHFTACMDIIRDNIRQYEEKQSAYQKETAEFFRAIQSGDVELYNQLITSQDLLVHTQNALRKNRVALNKAYFGRIDYEEKETGARECWYIGKNGVTKNGTDVVIVDWRAPVSSVYYENEMGDGQYDVPEGKPISIHLDKKRTYDVSDGKLLGYYDNDVASNDELLVKYLAQNKEAVLSDIIATIQKEQNEIIRDVPFKNVIVQGVAGSGKTTVAMHRISYVLYNYENRYKSSEFCIVGSNDMLLSYITSGLPELDVNNVKQMRMDCFLAYLMGKSFKKTYKTVAVNEDGSRKSRLKFAKELEDFLKRKREEALQHETIEDSLLGVLLTKETIWEICMQFSDKSLAELLVMMNERIKQRIQFLWDDDKDKLKVKQAAYRGYFAMPKSWKSEQVLYLEFLQECGGMEATVERVKKQQFDVYDIAALALIWKRIFVKNQPDEFSQIIVDEAQDFGEMLYYVMQQVLPKCYFTIMGDVSQNINYETGMNDWESLKEGIFMPGRDSFRLLAKSYRNTIEISEFAGKVLEKASAGQYRIQPVIRHGKAVECIQETEEHLAEKLKELTEQIEKKGYETTAVVCRNKEEAEDVKKRLAELWKQDKKKETKLQNQEESQKESQEEEQEKKQKGNLKKNQEKTEQALDGFHKGLMVLPIEFVKGLEFDAVILWKPDSAHYGNNAKEAKLLYVAITRALHELYLLGTEEMTDLIK